MQDDFLVACFKGVFSANWHTNWAYKCREQQQMIVFMSLQLSTLKPYPLSWLNVLQEITPEYFT
jgi:hypothetical protein